MNDTLTPRESDVVRLVARGWSNQGIADELGLAVQTIKHCLTHIYAKTGLDNRTQLAVAAFRSGFVTVEGSGES